MQKLIFSSKMISESQPKQLMNIYQLFHRNPAGRKNQHHISPTNQYKNSARKEIVSIWLFEGTTTERNGRIKARNYSHNQLLVSDQPKIVCTGEVHHFLPINYGMRTCGTEMKENIMSRQNVLSAVLTSDSDSR